MDLFLVNKTTANSNYLPYGIAVIGVLGFLTLFKLLGGLEGGDQENDQSKKMNEANQKPAGIYNQGNTCFVNSVLQALSSIESFQTMLKQTCKVFRGQLSANQQMIIQLSRVIDDINQSNESISVSRLLDCINEIKQGLINLQQQDAHQLYTAIIGSIETVLNKQKKMDLTASARLFGNQQEIIENPLVGYIKTSSTCTTCRTQTTIKIDPFYDISLDISKMYVVSVKAALFEFQKQEKIDHWTCTTCSLKAHTYRLKKSLQKLNGRNKQKLTFIGKAILDFLQNQDFSESQVKEINYKLSLFVSQYQDEYEKILDDPEKNLIFRQLDGVESSIIKRAVITKYPKILVLHMKQLVINPYTGEPYLLKKQISFEQILAIEGKNRKNQYCLTGLLTHLGNELYGHYIAFRRANRESQQWYMISDSMSKKTNWQTVKNSKAYMLFYEIK